MFSKHKIIELRKEVTDLAIAVCKKRHRSSKGVAKLPIADRLAIIHGEVVLQVSAIRVLASGFLTTLKNKSIDIDGYIKKKSASSSPYERAKGKLLSNVLNILTDMNALAPTDVDMDQDSAGNMLYQCSLLRAANFDGTVKQLKKVKSDLDQLVAEENAHACFFAHRGGMAGMIIHSKGLQQLLIMLKELQEFLLKRESAMTAFKLPEPVVYPKPILSMRSQEDHKHSQGGEAAPVKRVTFKLT